VKVGFVIDDHMGRPGGVQEYIRGLRQYLRSEGHTSVVFTGAGGPPEDQVIPLGISLPLRGSGSSTSVACTLHSPARLRSILEREACDVLHVMAPYSPTLSGRLLMQSRAAHVMTFLVAVEPAWYRRLLIPTARAQWRSLARFHRRVAISRAALQSAQTFYPGDYELLPVGMELERFRPPSPPRTCSRDGTVTVLYLGRLEQRKGVARLLRAMALLRPQAPHVRVRIAGDGPERATLERLAGELDLSGVEFLGYVPGEELPALLHSADIFCAPSTHAESFGIVLIEAMAAGLPIIAAANAGYAEVLGNHPGNLLVPPGDARALAGALATLLLSPDYLCRVGARNMDGVERYGWRSVGAALLRVYDEALAAAAG